MMSIHKISFIDPIVLHYNYIMRTLTQIDQEQFQQKLQFQQIVPLYHQSQALPLYKLAIRPYDYYIQFSFQSHLARLHFYQQLQTLTTLIVPPQYIKVQQIEKSYFQKWFGLAQKNMFSISCYLKYYNYTIRDWIDHQKQCGSVISEQEILMVMKQLLTFHKFYQEFYRQSCNVFKAELIFITPEKCLRIYPQCIKYVGQISIKREQQTYLNSSAVKLDKQVSFETTLSNSQANNIQTTRCTEYYDSSLNPDLRDIFILILQLISFKKYEHFYSHKHSMIIWDSISSLLDSISVSHLSKEFIHLLKQCGTIKNFDSQWLLVEVERLICTKDRMCKTVHIEKNQQLAELVMKKVQSQRSKKLDDLKFITHRDIRRSLTQSFHSY